MKRAALALLFVSCAWPRGFLFRDPAPPTLFVTRCGVEILGPRAGELTPDGWTLAEVQPVEDAALRAFATLADKRFLTSCARLKGWTIDVAPTKNIRSHDGLLEGGDTNCGMGRIFVGSNPPSTSRLAHEYAHAIQGCKPLEDGKDYLDMHLGWAPIYVALKAEGLPE